ncbi:zinc finger protein 624-like [Ochlerotatus camptorhynchus]|uniref:zinc finger protein 624-like n=1 Tax=Ochlerotatus camptorhynchus TaxID=644619 RepID=UPI0031E29199
MDCVVPDCSYSSQPDCVFIRFPENETLRERWKRAIEFGSGLLAQCTPSGKAESHDLAICSWHFEDKSFSDYQEPCLFEDRNGELSEVCSCRICLQFYHRNEMVSMDSKVGRKTVSGLIKRILGLTLEDKDFLMQICEECLVKLDICLNWIQEAKTVGAQFNELAVAAENEKTTFLESKNELVELCDDQDLCVDEFVETIRIDQDSSKYVAFEVDLIPEPGESQYDSNVEFVAVASDETGLLLTEKSPKRKRRRGPARARKRSLPVVVVQKQDFKAILARKCYICNTLHSSNNDLIGHLPTHAANADYQCAECGDKRFNKVSSYNHHLSFHDLENRPMKCDLCKLGFSTVPSLKAHQNREHGADHVLCKPKRRTTGKSYQCDTCGKTFRNCYQLREHDNFYHKKIFTAVCTVCSKPFPTKSLLLKHYIVHSGEKPYKCDWCGEAYKNSTCLDNHVLKHKSGRLKGKRKN